MRLPVEARVTYIDKRIASYVNSDFALPQRWRQDIFHEVEFKAGLEMLQSLGLDDRDPSKKIS
jgi:hypothetical protein